MACNGDRKDEAKQVVAQIAGGDPTDEGHVAKEAAAGRMLKTLVLGGNFDPQSKKTVLAEPRLGFAEALYPVIKEQLVEWACSDSNFVVVALLESEDVDVSIKKDVTKKLKKGRKAIEAASKAPKEAQDEKAKDKKLKTQDGKGGNAGAKILLGSIDA